MTQTYEQKRFTLAASFSGMVWLAYAAIRVAFSHTPTTEIMYQLAFTILAGTLACIFYILTPRYIHNSPPTQSDENITVISE